jgi:NADPH:quinone reductase-like Zn-dependent oxidoreductase
MEVEMRAYAIDEFGVPGSVRELPDPAPGEGAVLVRVVRASLNAMDAVVVNGFAKDWLEHRFPLVPGIDLSGVVEATGSSVEGVSQGDEVFGVVETPFFGAGSLAELTTTPVSAVAIKPRDIEHDVASTLPVAGLTALSAVDLIDPQDGQNVVVLGATGGVGSFVVQMAAARGAQVVADTRAENAQYASALGAAEAIDYTSGSVAEQVRARFVDGVDAMIDAAGGGVLTEELLDVVRRGGTATSVAGGITEGVLEPRGIAGGNTGRAPTHRLPELADLVTSGRLRAPEVRTRPLDGASDALAEQASRHVRGKLVLELG